MSNSNKNVKKIINNLGVQTAQKSRILYHNLLLMFILTCFIAVGSELLKLILSRDVLLLFLTNTKLLIQVFDDLEFFAHFDFLSFFFCRNSTTYVCFDIFWLYLFGHTIQKNRNEMFVGWLSFIDYIRIWSCSMEIHITKSLDNTNFWKKKPLNLMK